MAGARTAGTVPLGPELSVNRLGFGAMRITGDGIWGEPERPDEARAVLPAMLPIPGTSSVAHVEENMAAASFELDDELARRLEG